MARKRSCTVVAAASGTVTATQSDAITEQDGLSFYPDWPTPTFYDALVAELQELVNGTKQPADVQTSLGDEYDSYVSSIR